MLVLGCEIDMHCEIIESLEMTSRTVNIIIVVSELIVTESALFAEKQTLPWSDDDWVRNSGSSSFAGVIGVSQEMSFTRFTKGGNRVSLFAARPGQSTSILQSPTPSFRRTVSVTITTIGWLSRSLTMSNHTEKNEVANVGAETTGAGTLQRQELLTSMLAETKAMLRHGGLLLLSDHIVPSMHPYVQSILSHSEENKGKQAAGIRDVIEEEICCTESDILRALWKAGYDHAEVISKQCYQSKEPTVFLALKYPLGAWVSSSPSQSLEEPLSTNLEPSTAQVDTDDSQSNHSKKKKKAISVPRSL